MDVARGDPGVTHSVVLTSSGYGSALYFSLWNSVPLVPNDDDDECFLLPSFPDISVHRSQLTDHLAAYSNRVLFISGDKNEVIGVAFQERQRQFFPAADLLTIANSGHDVPWTHAAETVAAIHSYVQSGQAVSP